MIGVTVLPEYFQCEGVEAVLDRLQDAGVTAITTSPYVMEPADEATGGREPPIDAGAGSVRLLDRPLWGKRELWVRTSPAFEPDRARYAGLRYQPPATDGLTAREGAVLPRVLDAARSRGMQVYLQVQAAIPPGYRVQFGGPQPDDLPRLPGGDVPLRRVANNGSLASPEIVAYGAAMLDDLSRQFPQLSGIRIDWPEYPPYSLDDMFVDFSPHAEKAAAELGFDFQRMRHDMLTLHQRLHGGMTPSHWRRWADANTFSAALADLLLELPGVLETTRFKAALSAQLMATYRRALDGAGADHVQLVANLFPWPWSLASGAATYRSLAPHCSAMAIKLYGMHWKMMFRFYCEALAAANPEVAPKLLVRALLLALDFMDEPAPEAIEDYSYPQPDEPYGVSPAAQRHKLQLAQMGAGQTPVLALVHSYGPLEDFRERLDAARHGTPHGVWINRYGYLSDAKLKAL